jgi:hypothetical protein
MNWKSELTINKTIIISRKIFWSSMGLFVLAGVISAFTESFDLKWLEVTIPFIGGISIILLVISWITPGILVLLGVPWLAHAWLRGINSIGISSSPWAQMSAGGKGLIYLYSILFSGLTVFAIIGFIRFNFQK